MPLEVMEFLGRALIWHDHDRILDSRKGPDPVHVTLSFSPAPLHDVSVPCPVDDRSLYYTNTLRSVTIAGIQSCSIRS